MEVIHAGQAVDAGRLRTPEANDRAYGLTCS